MIVNTKIIAIASTAYSVFAPVIGSLEVREPGAVFSVV